MTVSDINVRFRNFRCEAASAAVVKEGLMPSCTRHRHNAADAREDLTLSRTQHRHNAAVVREDLTPSRTQHRHNAAVVREDLMPSCTQHRFNAWQKNLVSTDGRKAGSVPARPEALPTSFLRFPGKSLHYIHPFHKINKSFQL